MSSTMVFYALSAFSSSASHLPFSSLIVSLILIELYIETGDLEGVYARGWGNSGGCLIWLGLHSLLPVL